MGIDADIAILGNPTPELLDAINARIGSVLHDQDLNEQFGNYFDEADEDGISRFQTMWRYWGPEYERGPWYDIAGVIMTVAGMCANPIHYGGDCDDIEDLEHQVTPEMLAEYWIHFVGPNGNAYRESFNTINRMLRNRS